MISELDIYTSKVAIQIVFGRGQDKDELLWHTLPFRERPSRWLPNKGNANPSSERKTDAAARALAAYVKVSTRYSWIGRLDLEKGRSS